MPLIVKSLPRFKESIANSVDDIAIHIHLLLYSIKSQTFNGSPS